MKKRSTRAAAFILAAALWLALPCYAQPGVSARSAILVDMASGRVLYEKRADERSLIASTTKIMTGLLVCRHSNLDDRMRIPAEAVGIEGSSMYLKKDEVLSVRELLYGLLLQSGNDAAVALAIYCGGTVEGFVAQMNALAEDLGLQDTHFANPNGLDSEENYSTARDMALLTGYALTNEAFAQIVSTRSVTAGERCLVNHNKLLWRYEGAIGVKTGYTKSAGRILVSAARRNGRTLIAVTFQAPDDWNDHIRMYEHGFSAFTLTALAQTGELLCTVPIASAQTEQMPLISQDELTYPLLPGEEVTYRMSNPTLLLPPLQKGAAAGRVTILLGGKPVGQVAVCWGATILE